MNTIEYSVPEDFGDSLWKLDDWRIVNKFFNPLNLMDCKQVLKACAEDYRDRVIGADDLWPKGSKEFVLFYGGLEVGNFVVHLEWEPTYYVDNPV